MSWSPCCRIVPIVMSGYHHANLAQTPQYPVGKAVCILGSDRLPQGSACGRKGIGETHKGKAGSSNRSYRDLHSISGMKKVLTTCYHRPTGPPHYHNAGQWQGDCIAWINWADFGGERHRLASKLGDLSVQELEHVPRTLLQNFLTPPTADPENVGQWHFLSPKHYPEGYSEEACHQQPRHQPQLPSHPSIRHHLLPLQSYFLNSTQHCCHS